MTCRIISKSKPKLPLLLDSGSQVNLINFAVMKSLPFECLKVDVGVQSASNHELNCQGLVVLPIEIGKVTVRIPFVAVKDLSYDALLSIQFLRKKGVKMDFSRLVLDFWQNGIYSGPIKMKVLDSKAHNTVNSVLLDRGKFDWILGTSAWKTLCDMWRNGWKTMKKLLKREVSSTPEGSEKVSANCRSSGPREERRNDSPASEKSPEGVGKVSTERNSCPLVERQTVSDVSEILKDFESDVKVSTNSSPCSPSERQIGSSVSEISERFSPSSSDVNGKKGMSLRDLELKVTNNNRRLKIKVRGDTFLLPHSEFVTELPILYDPYNPVHSLYFNLSRACNVSLSIKLNTELRAYVLKIFEDT